MQCPQCKRTVGAVAGAARIQCFGCGTVIELGGKGPPRGAEKESHGGAATKVLVAVVSLGVGLALLIGAGVGTYFLLSKPPQPQDTAVAEETSPAADPPPPAAPPPAATPEELVPAYVASAEERAAAKRVPESIRIQILEMWDQMSATTRKKLLIPKGSVARNSVENLMSSIEQREVRTMSALLQIEESDVQAVIQVEMADRAERALVELQNQN